VERGGGWRARAVILPFLLAPTDANATGYTAHWSNKNLGAIRLYDWGIWFIKRRTSY
jgi:hypothetical protein